MMREYRVGDEPLPGLRLEQLLNGVDHVWEATANDGAAFCVLIYAGSGRDVRAYVEAILRMAEVSVWIRDDQGNACTLQEMTESKPYEVFVVCPAATVATCGQFAERIRSAIERKVSPHWTVDCLGVVSVLAITALAWIGIADLLFVFGEFDQTNARIVTVGVAMGCIANCLLNVAYFWHLRAIWFQRLPGLVSPRLIEHLLLVPLLFVIAVAALFASNSDMGLANLGERALVVLVASIAVACVFWASRVASFHLLPLLWKGS